MSSPRPPSVSSIDIDKKVDIEHAEHAAISVVEDQNAAGPSSSKGKDVALEILGDSSTTPIHVTPEQDRAILRKIDFWLMPVICIVYFLQQLDKYVPLTW